MWPPAPSAKVAGMSAPLRIFLRLLGAVLFAGAAAAIVAIVIIGPADVGALMGKTCKNATDQVGEASQCNWRDTLSILRDLPWVVLTGAALLVATRPERDAPAKPRRLRWAGPAALVVTVGVMLVGVPVYAHAWTAVRHYKVAKEILGTPGPDLSDFEHRR